MGLHIAKQLRQCMLFVSNKVDLQLICVLSECVLKVVDSYVDVNSVNGVVCIHNIEWPASSRYMCARAKLTVKECGVCFFDTLL